jgi:hypothetical protein
MPLDHGLPGHPRIARPVVLLHLPQTSRIGQQISRDASHRVIAVHQESLDAMADELPHSTGCHRHHGQPRAQSLQRRDPERFEHGRSEIDIRSRIELLDLSPGQATRKLHPARHTAVSNRPGQTRRPRTGTDDDRPQRDLGR